MATATTAAVQKKTTLPPLMVETMQSLMPTIPALLPPDISTEQFRAALFLELRRDDGLKDCTQESLRDCVIKAATYGLLPGRDCHFVPFSNRRSGRQKEATYVPNYFGIILALERSGKMRRAFAHPVHEGDEWGFDMFADRPVHRPAATLGKKPGKELFYYGAIMFKDGTCAFEVLSLDDLQAIQKKAPAHDSGPWATDRVMMCRKSAIKRVAKYVKLTPQQRGLLEDDEARERDDIPEARHQQNLIDLFGDGAGSYEPPREASKNLSSPEQNASSPPGTSPSDSQRGLQNSDAARSGKKGTAKIGPAWDTIRAYEASGLLPEAVLAQIGAALDDSPIVLSDSEAFALASTIQDLVDQERQGGRG
jgi:recombination protein RecT